MEKSIKKVYSKNAIVFASFLGGPAIGGFLLAHNFATFENKKAARNSKILGLIATILVLSLAFLLPINIQMSASAVVIPALCAGLVAMLIDRFQSEEIEQHLKLNRSKKPLILATSYGLLGAFVLMGFLLVYAHVFPKHMFDRSFNVHNNVVVYVGEDVSDSIALNLVEIVKRYGFFEVNAVADMFLSSDSENNMDLKFVSTVYPPLIDSLTYLSFCEFENYINDQKAFDQQISFGFYDPEVKESIGLADVDVRAELGYGEINRLQKYEINTLQAIYYNQEVSIREILLVERAVKNLKAYFPPNKNIDFVFLKENDTYQMKFFVNTYMWRTEDADRRLHKTVDYIRDLGIRGDIELVLVNMQTQEEKKLN